jgi:hypothetical protein
MLMRPAVRRGAEIGGNVTPSASGRNGGRAMSAIVMRGQSRPKGRRRFARLCRASIEKLFGRTECRVTPLRGGPAMTKIRSSSRGWWPM